MADIGADIATYIKADAGISALVGSRVFSDYLPQGKSMPAIVYTVISATPAQTLSSTPSSFSSDRIQVDCYATSRSGANTLAESVRIRMQNTIGDVGDSTVSAIALENGPYFGFDPAEAGTDQRRFITSLDFFVHHQTATS